MSYISMYAMTRTSSLLNDSIMILTLQENVALAAFLLPACNKMPVITVIPGINAHAGKILP